MKLGERFSAFIHVKIQTSLIIIKAFAVEYCEDLLAILCKRRRQNTVLSSLFKKKIMIANCILSGNAVASDLLSSPRENFMRAACRL